MEKKEHPVVKKRKIAPDKCVVTGKGDWYFPLSDIYETPENFTIVIDMPGVDTEHIAIDLRENELIVNGEISFDAYTDEKVILNEYNVGHYHRHFVISDAINRNKVEAKMKDGVLTLNLPKAEHIKPRKIEVKEA
ncbi:MAG: Hsp20/alpha crystallin family protein [Candidatus Brocadiaceae bacterium]|nr:Hsp20/alpha crystallin family protein [Candidatus Brocadiaceae bacterium]